jgi:hypothetical protein
VPRLAGNSTTYTFALLDKVTGEPTDKGFDLVSVTTVIKEVLGIPAGAMSYSGFRVGLRGIIAYPEAIVDATTMEELEAALKERGVSPNMSRDAAGARGSKAHEVLELLAAGERKKALIEAGAEMPTNYGGAAVHFWDEAVQPFIDSGEILQVRSEVPVWSLKNRYCGTLDLAILWKEVDHVPGHGGWEILDAKTHKPAKGFTLDGKGAGFISDAVQCRAYRMAWEEMGLGPTIGQRTIVLRETGKWLEDKREVSEEFVTFLRRLYDQRLSFEEGSK